MFHFYQSLSLRVGVQNEPLQKLIFVIYRKAIRARPTPMTIPPTKAEKREYFRLSIILFDSL